ncbi:MAG: AAA family ATPase [Chloroflexi bacterium]|nr:AAA family ATPase [Chloroflexota bacterium]
MARPAIAIALPRDEREPVAEALHAADLEPIAIGRPEELEALLGAGREIAVAILDGEQDLDTSLEYYALLHEGGRDIPALMVLSPRALERVGVTHAGSKDEYFTRPYSVESIRWRVEAMMIRRLAVDDGSGSVIQTGPLSLDDWSRNGTFVAVFNPKGGVGKTTIAVNLAAALTAMGRRVLLVDGDTVTGHISSSLGLEHVRTLVDEVIDAHEAGVDPPEALDDLLAAHPSGMQVLVLSSSPLRTSLLDPARVAAAIDTGRRTHDVVVVDLHPDYDALNRAVFERADRILVPVTPDVPALRAAVQLRDVATALGFADRLAMVVNRANSGVSVADIERTIGMPALALVRSAGLQLVKAANEGRTVIDLFPREKVAEDFRVLAEQVVGVPRAKPEGASRLSLGALFGRRREAVRA